MYAHPELKAGLLKASTVVSLVALFVFCYAVAADSAPRTWSLTGVTFSDGGSASGWFQFDSDSEEISDWSISVEGGNTGNFPPFVYDASNSRASLLYEGNQEKTIYFKRGVVAPPTPPTVGNPERQLRITPDDPLTDDGGTVAVNTQTVAGEGSLEARFWVLNRKTLDVTPRELMPLRGITGGLLQSAPAGVPTVTSVPTLTLFGMLALLVMVGGTGVLVLRS